jgi:MYXO-CTERM domain-containing protein
MRALAGLALVALTVAVGAPALAAPVVESEIDGTATNNTRATAQAIPSSAFTTPVPATVYDPPGFPSATISGAGGGADVDFYSFSATGGTALFDIDNIPFSFDTILSLFTAAGTRVGIDADSVPQDPGTFAGLDSFLGPFPLPGPGTYYIAVSQFPNLPSATCASGVTLTRPDGFSGGSSLIGCTPGDSSFPASGAQVGLDYTLHVSLSNPAVVSTPVPAPASLAWVGLGVATLALVRRRRS